MHAAAAVGMAAAACWWLALSSEVKRLLVVAFPWDDNSVGLAAAAAKIVEVSMVACNVSVELAATAAGIVEASCCGTKLYGQTGVGKGHWCQKKARCHRQNGL